MSLPGVLCVGRVYCDLVFSGLQSMPKPGTEIYADKLSLHTGGGAAITAHYLAKLKHPTKLCANLPTSPFSTIIHEQIGTTVGLEFCSVEDDVDPQITVVLTDNTDRSFISRRAGLALPENYQDTFRNLTNAKSINHLHISELATLLDYPDLVLLARAANWTVSLDCAWDPDAMNCRNACPLIESVDVFLPNESEFEQLVNAGVTETSAPLTVIKRGASGAQAHDQNGVTTAPVKKTNCVDTTGAGDAFNAGFIHAWLDNQCVQVCLASGNRQGQIAVQQLGGIAR